MVRSEGNHLREEGGNDEWEGGYTEVGIHWRGVKKFDAQAELYGVGDKNPSATALRQTILLTCGPPSDGL